MLRLSKSTFLLGTALTLVAVSQASAQVSVGADAGIFSSYVWRGLTLSSKPVIQPDLWVSVPVGSGSITVGGWGNVELGKYDGTNDISEGGGQAGPDLTEFDWWGEYGNTFGKATLTLGATGYIYPNDFGLTSDANTIEVYGRLGFATVLSPRFSAYYDVDKIKGFYFEGMVNHSIQVSPSFSLTLGALAGLSAGQGINDDPASDESSNFFDDGLTHVDLSASTSFSAGSLSFAPAFHFQINSDEATKPHNADPAKFDESTKIWFGMTISWAGGGSDEE
ncbi:MAG: TorF family putative porin [Gemmatimonadota bacterium]